ncbi:MAG: 50S ribosomal protein L30 [Methanobacteriota archaeon]
MGKLAVIKLRSGINARQQVNDTLKMMGLTRINHCVIVDINDSNLGMIKKVKDFVTWGEVKPEVLESLLKKRGRLSGDKRVTEEAVKSVSNFQTVAELAAAVESGNANLGDVGVKKVFRFHPPRGGYKSTKRPVKDMGDLGYRGDKINDLIIRMI